MPISLPNETSFTYNPTHAVDPMPFLDRTFTIKTNDETSISIKLTAPLLQAQNLRFDTWGAAFILSNHLHKITLPEGALKPSDAGLQILELGAATGLTGLSAAAIWRSSVLLTDLEGVLSGVKANIDLNAGELKSRGARGVCGLLDWFDPSRISLYDGTLNGSIDCRESNKPGIILAADTVYSEEQPEILTNTIVAWLRRDQSSRAIICIALRVAYLDYIREFWDRMKENGLEPEEEGQEVLSEQDGFDDERLCEWSIWKWSTHALDDAN